MLEDRAEQALPHRGARAMRLRFRRPRLTARVIVGLLIIATVVAVCICAPLLAPYSPYESSLDILAGPSSNHLLGTDDLGEDILSRLLFGSRISLTIGLGAAIIAALIGVPLGLVAGYFGGFVDALISYLINFFVSMPSLVLAVLITAVVGSSLANLVLVLGFVGWPPMARLVRGQALVIREKMFVEAARIAGAGPVWILWHHVRPNISRLMWSQLSLNVALAIFTSSSLSFLGLGVPPPEADWGGMVRVGGNYLAINPAMGIAPSVAVAFTILGFYLVGSDN
jgi:peptide/nickel transport system permease protein